MKGVATTAARTAGVAAAAITASPSKPRAVGPQENTNTCAITRKHTYTLNIYERLLATMRLLHELHAGKAGVKTFVMQYCCK